MRRIDRWCGVPACFLATLALRLHRLLGGRARVEAGPPRRILFVGLAEVGALIVNHAAIARARARFPGAELYFLTFAQGREALGLMGFDPAHALILRAGSPVTLAVDTVRALVRARRLGIDATVNFEVFVRFSTLLAALTGAGRRAGFHPFGAAGVYVGELVTHRVIYSPHHHAAQMSLALVEALADEAAPCGAGDEPMAKVPAAGLPLERLQIPADPERLARIRAKLAAEASAPLPSAPRFVLLNANASDLIAVRRWPVERYAELARRLLEDPSVVIVLTGVGAERPAATGLAQAIGDPRVVNMAGRTSLAELIDLFHAAALLVTNDSGPAHFASVTEVPTIVLFGPETPRIFGPLGPRQEAIWLALACSPCVSVYNQKRSPCHDNRCMTGITVEMVLARARALL